MSVFFVTGCGTDIGKTFISCALLKIWRNQGLAVDAFKPVLSGIEPGSDDAATLLKALEREETAQHRAFIAPNQFVAPLSPHIAAAKEGVLLSAGTIIKQCCAAITASQADIMLIEGAGGVAVPINHHELILDIIIGLKTDIIFITSDYLGSISHSLTALHMLKHHSCNVRHIVINQSDASVGLDAMADTLRHFSPYHVPITRIPRMNDNESVIHIKEVQHMAQSIAQLS